MARGRKGARSLGLPMSSSRRVCECGSFEGGCLFVFYLIFLCSLSDS
jgi:hypothetical protein